MTASPIRPQSSCLSARLPLVTEDAGLSHRPGSSRRLWGSDISSPPFACVLLGLVPPSSPTSPPALPRSPAKLGAHETPSSLPMAVCSAGACGTPARVGPWPGCARGAGREQHAWRPELPAPTRREDTGTKHTVTPLPRPGPPADPVTSRSLNTYHVPGTRDPSVKRHRKPCSSQMYNCPQYRDGMGPGYPPPPPAQVLERADD